MWCLLVPSAHHHTRPKDHAVSPRADHLLRFQLLQVEANSSPQDRPVFVSPSLMFTRHSLVVIGTTPSSSFTLSQTSSRCFWKDLCKSGQNWLTFRGKKNLFTLGEWEEARNEVLWVSELHIWASFYLLTAFMYFQYYP